MAGSSFYRRTSFYRRVPHGNGGKRMANTRAKCTQCKGYFPQPSFYYSNTMQRLCTEECFNEWRGRKTPTVTQVKAKKASKRSAPPKIPIALRFEIKKRDKHNCRWCGKPGQEAHHIHYRSEGGPNEPSNLIYLCQQCHGRAHSSKEAFKPLLLATIWMLYVEGQDLPVPVVAGRLRSMGLLTELQETRLAS